MALSRYVFTVSSRPISRYTAPCTLSGSPANACWISPVRRISPPDGQGDRHHEIIVFSLAGKPCVAAVSYRRREGRKLAHQRGGIRYPARHAQPAALQGNRQGPDQFPFRESPYSAISPSLVLRGVIRPEIAPWSPDFASAESI